MGGLKLKGKRIFLIGLISLMFLILAFNFHKVKFALDLLKIYREEKGDHVRIDTDKALDNPLDEILKALDEGIDGDGADEVAAKDDEVDEVNGQLPADSNGDHKDRADEETLVGAIVDKGKAPRPKDSNKDTSSKSYISIVSQYNNSLLDLKEEFEAKLDSLIKQGIKEYSQGNSSKAKLANKYLDLGSKIEKDCDSKFEGLIKEMEKELKANDHPTSIIKDTRDYYYSYKSAKKADILRRGMKHLN